MALNRTLSIVAAVLVVAIGLVGVLVYQTLIRPALVHEEPRDTATTTTEIVIENPQTIGQSVEGRPIEVYTFGDGGITLLFVGGIHGGYEWNSSLLAWQMIDHFAANETEIPALFTVHIIPSLNPDGLAKAVGTGGRFTLNEVLSPTERLAAGRFNANGVDLNRNFACNWAPESTWRGAVVSAGTAAFSEPEAAAFREYVLATQPNAVAFWHSQANTVYGSACNGGVLPETSALGAAYATAGQYGWVPLFDAYPITGDAEGWLASIGIPAVTVELESFDTTEWTRNIAGVESWFTYYSSLPPVVQ